METFHEIATAHCAPALQDGLAAAISDLGHTPVRLPSGAGHDAQVMAQLCPSAMLFVRCRGGISHNPAEFASVADMGLAIAALIRFIERFDPGKTRERFHRPQFSAPGRIPQGAGPRAVRQSARRLRAACARSRRRCSRSSASPSNGTPCPIRLRQAARHGVGDQRRGARAFRHRKAGDRAQRAWRRGAARRRAGPTIPTAPTRRAARSTDAAPQCRSPTFPTYAFAILALKDDPAGLNGTVELHLTYDEEAGGFVGPKWLLDEKITKPDFAICAGFSYAVVTAHNGVLHLEVTVKGRQAHAAVPESGADALEAATGVLAALYQGAPTAGDAKSRRSPGIGTPKLTVGLISGGVNTNVVPDVVTLRLDRRLIPEENGTKVEKDLIALIKRAAKRKGISVECRRIILAEPLRPVAGVERLVEPLRRHAQRELKDAIPVKGVPLYTDARHYSAAGIPTVLYGAGPRSILEANAHGADEHVILSDLKAATKIVEATLRDCCQSRSAIGLNAAGSGLYLRPTIGIEGAKHFSRATVSENGTGEPGVSFTTSALMTSSRRFRTSRHVNVWLSVPR